MSMLKGAKTAGLAVLMAMAMAATGAGGAQAQSSVTFTGWGGITQEAVLKNAPAQNYGCFLVPKVVE